jgi:hypothetical protein
LSDAQKVLFEEPLKDSFACEGLKLRNQQDWLGGRDSNPDRQIQSPSQADGEKEDQGLGSGSQEEVRQNPQHRRNKND